MPMVPFPCPIVCAAGLLSFSVPDANLSQDLARLTLQSHLDAPCRPPKVPGVSSAGRANTRGIERCRTAGALDGPSCTPRHHGAARASPPVCCPADALCRLSNVEETGNSEREARADVRALNFVSLRRRAECRRCLRHRCNRCRNTAVTRLSKCRSFGDSWRPPHWLPDFRPSGPNTLCRC